MTTTELDLQPIKRANVVDMAMATLLDLIRRKVLRPGDQLPSQRELVSRMRLSQTGIREALRGLATIGIIEIHPGRGAFVRSLSPEMLVNPEFLYHILERETLIHALEVRKVLEVEAIGLAAERATSQDLADLERILRQIEQGLPSDDNRLQSYFHLAIAKATHNPVLINMVKSFVRLLQRGDKVVADQVPGAKEREYRLHAELYEPILTRNPAEARRRMLDHLEVAKTDILKGFSE